MMVLLRISACLVLGLGLTACRSARSARSARAGGDEGVRKVLLLGVDGLRSDQWLEARTPVLDAVSLGGLRRLDATNAWTLDEPSNGHSAPNWTAVLTGRRPSATGVSVNGDHEHLVDDDHWEPGKIRTVFGHAKAANPECETVAFHTWPGIGVATGTILGRSVGALDHHFLPAVDGPSHERDELVTRRAVEVLLGQGELGGTDPDLLFVYYSQCDAAGHEFTYEDPDYRASIESVDREIGKVLAALGARSTRERERWLVLVMTDHGGPSDAKSHGDNGDPHVRTVPLLGAADGAALGLEGPVSIYDVTPTVLDWLDVSAGPFFGRSLLTGEPLEDR